MKQITKQEFLQGYSDGYISDIVSIGNRVYGKDPRGMAHKPALYEVVYCEVS